MYSRECGIVCNRILTRGYERRNQESVRCVRYTGNYGGLRVLLQSKREKNVSSQPQRRRFAAATSDGREGYGAVRSRYDGGADIEVYLRQMIMKEMLEPYDPEYLRGDAGENPYRLSAREKRRMRALSRVEKLLKRNMIPHTWDDGYRVERCFASYRDVRYLWVTDYGTFCYGTNDQCLCESADVNTVCEVLLRWWSR